MFSACACILSHGFVFKFLCLYSSRCPKRLA
ncbi:hypothetical protein GLYMA_20G190851v4 [Glycine max]|nr:hypothetical protein GLYMA_20G190851v4 [Glycine max]KAH1036889.1 hypothetical protein GYH30_056356 [Glycine max]